MWGYYKLEFKQFFTNKKNLAIYLLLAFTALFYAFKVAPDYDPIEKVDYEEIEARYLTRQELIDGMEGRDLYQVHPTTVDAYVSFSEINPFDKARMDALDSNDLKKYAEVTSDWYFMMNYMNNYNQNLTYNDRYYVRDREFAHADGFFNSLDQHVRYEAFEMADYELSLDVFEQRTALQTFERLLKGPLPIILIIGALLLAIDIVTKDRLHPSVLKGFPIADWQKLLVKLLVALLGSAALFVPLLPGFAIVGLQWGFGHLQLPSPVYTPGMLWTEEGMFKMMTLGTFLGRSLLLLFAWFLAIISAVLLCSVMFRQEMVNLAVGMLIIFGERFYASRGVGYFWEVEKFPTTYIQVGQIVSKYQNFYFMSDKMDYRIGLMLIIAAAAVILAAALLISLKKRFKLVK